MKSDLRAPGNKELTAIRYKCISQKVLVFIDTEGGGSTETGITYLYRYYDNYYNFIFFPVICPHVTGRYFSSCNVIYN